MTEEITCQVPEGNSKLQGFDFTADYSGDGTTLHDVLVVVLPLVVIAVCILVGMYIYHHHEWLKRRLNYHGQD